MKHLSCLLQKTEVSHLNIDLGPSISSRHFIEKPRISFIFCYRDKVFVNDAIRSKGVWRRERKQNSALHKDDKYNTNFEHWDYSERKMRYRKVNAKPLIRTPFSAYGLFIKVTNQSGII